MQIPCRFGMEGNNGPQAAARLRTFVTVADQGTVSLAAETLRITQPALSRQLQDLQAEFGVALFNQVGRRLRLTAERRGAVAGCRAPCSAMPETLVEAAGGR